VKSFVTESRAITMGCCGADVGFMEWLSYIPFELIYVLIAKLLYPQIVQFSYFLTLNFEPLILSGLNKKFLKEIAILNILGPYSHFSFNQEFRF